MMVGGARRSGLLVSDQRGDEDTAHGCFLECPKVWNSGHSPPATVGL